MVQSPCRQQMPTAHLPLLSHYNRLPTVPGLSNQHVLACPTLAVYPPPLLRTETTDPAARAHNRNDEPVSAPRLSLCVSPTDTRQLPTPICFIIKAEGLLCSLHLVLAFSANNADTAPTLIAAHVPHGSTCLVSSATSRFRTLEQHFGLISPATGRKKKRSKLLP